jgi:hypothetical protein
MGEGDNDRIVPRPPPPDLGEEDNNYASPSSQKWGRRERALLLLKWGRETKIALCRALLLLIRGWFCFSFTFPFSELYELTTT